MSYWIWWAVALLLVGAEILSGAFYMLALGLAFVFGGIVAWSGFSFEAQCIATSLFGIIGCLLAYRWNSKNQGKREVSLDVGQFVSVISWGESGRARVAYRGSQWDAELATPETPRQQTMRIVATKGSLLIIAADEIQRPATPV